MEKVKTWNHKGHCASVSSYVFFSEAAPTAPPKKKIIVETSCSKISQNFIGNPRWISLLVAGHRPSYLLNCVECSPWNFETVIFPEYLRLIAVIKSSQQKCSVLKNFAIFTRKHLCWSPQACNFIKKKLQYRCFVVNITKILRTPILKTSANVCFV